MIERIFWPFYFGAGGPIASGKQYFPWIHVNDVAGLYHHAIQTDMNGVYNAVSPQTVTNGEFSSAFAQALWRPAFIPLPGFVPKVMFGPERAKIMTEGQKVIPKRTVESGYEYIYPDIKDACKACAVALYKIDGID